VTVFELSAYGAALVKCNDTGDLAELRPKPADDDENHENHENDENARNANA
jgi:hypothetical protein